LLFAHDLSGKPLRTFPDHALELDHVLSERGGFGLTTIGSAAS
jgi:hypothetical protein